MKLTRYQRRPQMDAIRLKPEPLIIWLTDRLEMRVERGDRLSDVIRMVNKKRPDWSQAGINVESLVSYWFSLGERLAADEIGETWSNVPVNTRERRYLIREE